MQYGYTALIRAAGNGRVNVVQYLVEVGGNFEALVLYISLLMSSYMCMSKIALRER